MDQPASDSRSVQRLIVDDNNFAVGRKTDVDLYLIDAECDCFSAGEQAVFRPEQGAAAMCDDLSHRSRRSMRPLWLERSSASINR